MKVLVEVLVQGPDAFGRDAGSAGVGGVGAEGRIDPRPAAPRPFARFINAAFRIALHAEHQRRDVPELHLGAAGLTAEVEFRGLEASEVAPEMVPFAVIVDGGDGLFRKEGDPAAAVETALDDQKTAAMVDQGPAMGARLSAFRLHGAFLPLLRETCQYKERLTVIHFVD